MDILNFKPKNILPEEAVDLLAEYWCNDDESRDENLGAFIQRVAEVGMKTAQCPECEQNRESGMNFCAFCGRQLWSQNI